MALAIAFVVSLLYDRSSRAKVVAMSGLVINGPAFNGEFSTLIYIFRDSLPALKSSKKSFMPLKKVWWWGTVAIDPGADFLIKLGIKLHTTCIY